MGIFDSITGFIGKLADGAVKTIAPGLNWKPSSLISQASKLMPTLINAIPGVGTAIPAIEAVFSGSERKVENGRVVEVAAVPGLEDVKKMLAQTLDAVTSSRKDLETKLTAVLGAVESQGRLEKFESYRDKIIPAVEYLESHMDALNEFVPYSTSEKIKSFVPKDNQTPDTDLIKRQYELKSAVSEMQAYLKTHEHDVTQEMFDLYLLAVVWLLTYDKMIMTLRSYLAQHYFAINTMTDYIKAITTWNTDYDEMVRHATSAADFLLGKESDRTDEGYIGLLTKKRLSLIGDAQKEPVEDVFGEQKRSVFRNWFVDTCPTYVIGYASPEKSKLLQEIRSKPEATAADAEADGNSIRTSYYGVQASFLEACLRPAVEFATTWRTSVYGWQSRLPLTPPADLENAVKILQDVDVTTGLKQLDVKLEDQKGLGYKTGETLTYAVAYVTSFGEGFPSGWSTPKEIAHDGRYVQISLKPVAFRKSGYENYKAAKPVTDRISEAQIILRVYVKKSVNDESRIFHVGDIPSGSADVKLWDVAHRAYPTPK
ncbi:hypothetical protein FA15DRAFT_709573 [Coprinopsis marcescibilis]|uniref:Uncharacterized protein n=1 Tax=Coprinopsis marcescibilis TaxID=230819 RepID=A0A5C3KSI6_COPMA|nr:hypothetical protein FA15DRAFT_709573 [Coprinopsis marcescibilis]